MIERLILTNLRRAQTFDRNLRTAAGLESIAAGFVDQIMFQPNGERRNKSIDGLKLKFFEHARDDVMPQADRVGDENARSIVDRLPPAAPLKPAELRNVLFAGKRRADERLQIIRSSVQENGDTLGQRLTRYWLEPAEGGNEEKLARLRETHAQLEARRKAFDEKYREFIEGKSKARPSKPQLDFMSATTENVKQDVRVQARRAGTDAEIKLFQQRGHKNFAWIAVGAGDACPDCMLRQGVILTLEEWERVGRPGSGETICKDHCFCMLVPETTLRVSSSLATSHNLRGNKGVLTTPAQRALFDANRNRRPDEPKPTTPIDKTPGDVGAIASVKPDVATVQPVNDRAALFDQARETKPKFDDLVNKGKGVQADIGATASGNLEKAVEDFHKPGAVVITSDIKDESRSAEKVQSKFGGNYNRLTDVVRSTIAVDKSSEIPSVLAVVKRNAKAESWEIVEVDNKFATPTEAGYRDVNLRLRAPTGHIVELQVNTKAMISAKVDGHKLYEKARTIDAKALIENRKLTDAEAVTIKELNGEMKSLYADAWKKSGGGGPAIVEPVATTAGLGDGPANRPADAGKKIAPPKSDADMKRFIADVEATPEYREAVSRLAAYRDEVSDGDIRRWSLEKNSKGGKLLPERAALHDRLISEFVTKESIAPAGERPKAVMLLGPPGSGKTTAGGPQAKKLGDAFATINADNVKERLPEYRGWNAALVHEESSEVAEGSMLKAAVAGRHHILFDATGANAEKMIAMADELGRNGYDVHIINVELPAFKATGRAWERFQGNAFNWTDAGGDPGRFVPPKYSYEGVGNKPTKTYHALKDNPNVKSWVSVDNDVPRGSEPKIVDKGERK